MKKRYQIVGGVFIFTLSLWLINSQRFGNVPSSDPLLLAHRGVHQSFEKTGVDNDSCTASRMDEPTHNFLENTRPSIGAAFDYGADIVEINVHPTTDGEFAVFHDWTLDCRTDGTGRVRDHDSAALKALDIGFGYTADGGQTYPFRGKSVGQMPMLGEVLDAFPAGFFLINIKSGSADEGRFLMDYLSARGADMSRIGIYGHQNPVDVIREMNQDLMTMSKQQSKNCLKTYAAIGWSSYVPKSCRKTLVPIPANYARLVWGWPNRFQARLSKYGSGVVLMGPHTGARAEPAIDTVEQLRQIPEGFGGIIWTNKIELIGPAMKSADANAVIEPSL